MLLKEDNDGEKIPLLLIWNAIVRHWKIATAICTVFVLLIVGFFAYGNYKEKRQKEEYIKQSLIHLMGIVGTYGNNNVKLVLNADNTAILTTETGSYSEKQHLGHWEEKSEGYPIRIDFSDVFSASICGEDNGYFSTLYFYDNSLWENINAIRSKDYNAREYLTKE